MVKQKNPLIAFLLAFIPGAGLMYLGKAGRGIAFFIVTMGAFFLSIVMDMAI